MTPEERISALELTVSQLLATCLHLRAAIMTTYNDPAISAETRSQALNDVTKTLDPVGRILARLYPEIATETK